MYRGLIGFVLYVLIGFYLVNIFTQTIVLSESIAKYNDLFSCIGGILLVFAGVNYLRLRRMKNHKKS